MVIWEKRTCRTRSTLLRSPLCLVGHHGELRSGRASHWSGGDCSVWAILSGLVGLWAPHIEPHVLTSRESLDCSACPLPHRIPKPCEDMGRHEHVAPEPSWTVVIVTQPSPLLHTVIAPGFCTVLGWVIGHISPSPLNGVKRALPSRLH